MRFGGGATGWLGRPDAPHRESSGPSESSLGSRATQPEEPDARSSVADLVSAMTAATKPTVPRAQLTPWVPPMALKGAPFPSIRLPGSLVARGAPTVLSAAVLASAALATPVLRDAATGRQVGDVTLALPTGYTLLAPWCDTLDALSLLSARQHLALVATVLVTHVAWRVGGRLRDRARRARIRMGHSRDERWLGAHGLLCRLGREVGRELGALGVLLLAIIAVYAASLAPRPMAALRPAGEDVVTVDFHSHTAASWDGRVGFGSEENRAWHRAAGFDVAFVTDHRSFTGAVAAEARNPRAAGDGTTLLTGIETRYRAQHLNVLGGTVQRDRAFLVGAVDPLALASAARSLAPEGILLVTVPAQLGEVPEVVAESGGAARAIELSDAAPRGLAQLDSARSRVLHLADSLDLAVVAGSDNHGWGRTSAAWSLLTIPGWRRVSPDSLSSLIVARIRQRGRRAVRVVERAHPHASHGAALALIAPAVVSTMLTQMQWPERVSWLLWTWGAWAAAVVVFARKQGHAISAEAADLPNDASREYRDRISRLPR